MNARLAQLEDLKARMLEEHETYLDTWSSLKEEEERLLELGQKRNDLVKRQTPAGQAVSTTWPTSATKW